MFLGKIQYYENGSIIPLPARLCFECGKSCRKAPLIACDYCPLYFHQDCLDPPLTAFPSGRWMCPNHLNHFIDQNLLTSCAATERLKLWDKFAHQQIDQHAVKLQFLRKAHSMNPPFRIKVKQHLKSRIRVPPIIKYHYANPPELDLCNLYRTNSLIYPTASKQLCTDDSKNECEEIQEEKKTENNDVVKPEIEEIGAKDNGVLSSKKENEEVEKVQSERTKEIIDKNQQNDSECEYDLEDNVFINSGLGFRIKEGISLLERPVLEVLAQQRLEQILNPSDECYQNINCTSKARALLFPLGKTAGPPVFMTCKTLNIGTGGESDLLLSKYGSCSFVSVKHAVIFFDKVNK